MVINFQSVKKAGKTERKKNWSGNTMFIIQRTDFLFSVKKFIIDHITGTAADAKKTCRIFGYDGVKW